jgi:hypothetical protein
MAFDILLDFIGEDGSNVIVDSGTNSFSVVQSGATDVVLTTTNPRLGPTSGLFDVTSSLTVESGPNILTTNDFRIEVWFRSSAAGNYVLFEQAGDMRLYMSLSGLIFRIDNEGYIPGGYISPEAAWNTDEWNRVIITRNTANGVQRTTGILNANVWFSIEDATNYDNGSDWTIGSRPPGDGSFIGQMAKFSMTRLEVGDPTSVPPTISTTLSEGTTQQVLNNHFTGEEPRLVRSPYSSTDSSIGEWDMVSGFSAGFQIPRVRVRCDNYANLVHTRNDDIGDPSFYTNASPRIWLDWEGGLQSQEWLNYDPHYFLFYRSRKKKRRWNDPSRPENKARGIFTTYVHPANYVNGVNVSMVTNMGGGDADFFNYADSGNRASEWRVPSKRFTKIDISDSDDVSNPFNAWQYYKNGGLTLFPIAYNDWYTSYRSIGNKTGSFKQKKCLSLRFCIAVRDPLQPNRLVFGPMSESVMIYPILGYFTNGVMTDERWYYRWGAVIKS